MSELMWISAVKCNGSMLWKEDYSVKAAVERMQENGLTGFVVVEGKHSEATLGRLCELENQYCLELDRLNREYGYKAATILGSKCGITVQRS